MIKQHGLGINNFSFMTFGFTTATYDPVTLFSAGQQGAIFDPSDLTSLWQDALGTVPVTKSGDPVGLVKDKSGNGNHAKQTLSAARPTYQTDGILHWLKFDGVDDFLKVTALNMSAYADLNIFAAAKRQDNIIRVVAEFSANSNTNQGCFYLVAGANGAYTGWTTLSRGSADLNLLQASGINTTTPETSVISSYHNIPNDLSTIRRNKGIGADATGDKGLGTFGNHDLYIGSRAGTNLFFNSELYALVVSSGEATTSAVTNAESYLASKAGVTL